MNKTITVVYSFDDNYAELASVSMFSLVYNTKRDLHIHIFENSLSAEVIAKILTIEALYTHAKITVHHIPDDLFEEVKDRRFGKESWYPMLAPEILHDLDKALVLEPDTLICRDISELFDMELGECYVAGFPYHMVSLQNNETPLFMLLSSDSNLFNGGVLLYNLKAIRDDDLFNMQRLIAMVAEIKPFYKSWFAQESYHSFILDQDRVICLPPKYNSFLIGHMFGLVNLPLNPLMNFSEFFEATNDPVIIHYINKKPNEIPKKSQGIFALHRDLRCEKWWEYLALSPFADSRKDWERQKAIERQVTLLRKALYHIDYYREYCLPYDFLEAAKKLKELEASGKKIIIYGAGDRGREFTRFVRLMDTKVAAVCDYRRRGYIVDGLKISSPETLKNRVDDSIVVVAIETPNVLEDVMDNLKGMGFAEKHLFPVFEHLAVGGRRWEEILDSIEL